MSLLCKTISILFLLIASNQLKAAQPIELVVSGHNSNFSLSSEDQLISISSLEISKNINVNSCNRLYIVPDLLALQFKLHGISKYLSIEKFNNKDRYKFIYLTYNGKRYKLPRSSEAAKFVILFPKTLNFSYLASKEKCI